MPRIVKHKDPRRPDAVTPFKYQESDDDLAVADLLSFVSIGMGLAGMWFQNRWFSWAAFLACVVSICNHGGSSGSGPPTSMVAFSIVGLATAYNSMLLRGELTPHLLEVEDEF
ncbi:hypothetical protein BDZ88DRAFT_421024 [Geranomyces variabilis]|nr:hypothetical protein BDZ88DRAFT_421024 [Geranomyces variabilis]KAJ3138881.1 hypothetical protein HDU90_000786 [Geranomyces variabilis]